jgi:phage baseplate assembly protein gpV
MKKRHFVMAITYPRDQRTVDYRDGIFYEFDRQDGTLAYAASTTKDAITTTIVGSGRCEIAAAPMRVKTVLKHKNKKPPGIVGCVLLTVVFGLRQFQVLGG